VSWLGVLGIGKSLLKSKFFWVAIIFIIISVYVWKYTSLTKDLQSAYADLQGLSSALETTNKSLDNLQSELKRVDKFTQQREEGRDSVRAEIEQLREQLRKERENNERLQECYSVPLSDELVKRLQPVPKTD